MLDRKKYYLSTIFIIGIGIALRLFVSSIQPIWLDEQYSIFYATQFKTKKLLYQLSTDTQPGLYYFFLKNALKLTTNKILLRTITSTFPQIFGILLLAWYYIKQKRLKELQLITFILSFNPFFIHLAFQLRNYSLVFFITIFTYIYLQLWQKYKKNKYLIFIFLGLLMGNFTHYVMYIFSLASSIFITLSLKASRLKRVVFFLIGTVVLIGQFLIFNGFSSPQQYKHQFREAGWIALPSFHNIPKVYLTALGFATDVMNTSTNYQWLFSFIFYTTFVIFILIFIKQKSKINSFFKQLLILSLFPLGGILFLSSFLTFLSHRIFIHQFIPQISLFIPRIQLPFIIIFWISITQILAIHWASIKKTLSKAGFYSLLLIFSLYWGAVNYRLNIKNSLSLNSRQRTVEQILNKKQNTTASFYLWPHWVWFEAINLNDLDQVKIIGQLKKQSEAFEQPFNSLSTSVRCNNLSQSEIYVYTLPLQSQNKLQHKIIDVLNQCCVEQNQIESFKGWKCK